ncbi:MAG: prepilin-type N-terminal cleavage/methylation domain-containing protein, partial [Actinobacteria bacterium]|nr:prepilin-type N-terminal cleavage/methylation domain-containing protein [Actinomycetota bacterium]
MKVAKRRLDNDSGFTLIEILVAISIVTILLGLSVPTLRIYWMRQSLSGGADAVVAEMRGSQARVVSETHPLVYGMRFTDSGNWNFDGKWGLVK